MFLQWSSLIRLSFGSWTPLDLRLQVLDQEDSQNGHAPFSMVTTSLSNFRVMEENFQEDDAEILQTHMILDDQTEDHPHGILQTSIDGQVGGSQTVMNTRRSMLQVLVIGERKHKKRRKRQPPIPLLP